MAMESNDIGARTAVGNDVALDEKNGTRQDKMDMDRMGKLQELRRNFKFMSIFGYAVILGSSWEYALVCAIHVIGISLTNGGTAGGIWMFLTVCLGMFFVMLSMAEMASMAPTSGGQFHWVSEIAPRKHQRSLSYIVGWMCVIGWQAAMASSSYAAAQQIQGLIALNNPSYVIRGWHGTLFTVAITILAAMWNTVLISKLPIMENIAMILHVLGFFAFVVVLWVMGSRSDTKTVWTNFEDGSGWGNRGVATLVGILGPVVTLIGSDSSCHLSEELRDAAWVLPRAMVATGLMNYGLGFVMTVTIMSTLGGDVPTLLATPLGQPWIQALYNATESKAGTSIMIAALCVLLLFCAINQMTTTSRQLFAFARDRGLPFSDFLAHVRPGWDVPVNAIIMTQLCTTILSLIIIGSTIAFNVITSLGLVGLILSYTIVIGSIFARRIRGEPLLPSRFNLGRSGILVNGVSLAFLSISFTFCFFPTIPKPDPAGMNWSCLIFGFVLGYSLIYYFAYGRYNYVGPVHYVKAQ